MNATGVTRIVCPNGRVCIPASTRRAVGWADDQEVEIHAEDKRVILTAADSGCHFCGKHTELHEHRGFKFCSVCVGEMAQVIREDQRQ